MKRKKLQDWAAISEIIASTAVVISLVFVVISINRNTAELRADNVNDFYDAIREIDIGVAANSEFADVVMRGQTGEYDELSPVEAYQYDYYVLLHLNIWEQAWDRHNDGTVSTEQYEFWKTYYYVFVRDWVPKASWTRIRHVYNEPFRQIVDAAYVSDVGGE